MFNSFYQLALHNGKSEELDKWRVHQEQAVVSGFGRQ
jgi:hypothetical protein